MLSIVSQLVIIVSCGTLAQIAAWHVRFPSIVLLLIIGLILGPVTEIVTPDRIFNDLLEPLVALAVAFILFEGGMTLQVKEAMHIGGPTLRLITLGALITLVLTAVGAFLILDLSLPLALLLAAILIVSGPTVVLPLLRQIRAKASVDAVLRWEGILIDPIGVVVAVLVFRAVLDENLLLAPLHIITAIILCVLFGVASGAIASFIVIRILERHLLPDHLHVPLVLSLLFASFEVANLFHHEAGLLAATVMGAVLSWRGGPLLRPIVELSSNVQALVLSALFIVLSARLSPEHLAYFNEKTLLFVAFLILVVRPLSVFAATVGTKIPFREKLFIGSLAPRGIVAASMASVLGAQLVHEGIPEGNAILAYTFATIVGTVVIYGFFAPSVCSALNLRDASPHGFLIIGADPFARNFAKVLQEQGVTTALIDTNLRNVNLSRKEGLHCYHGNALAETLKEEVDFNGLGRVLALTPNDEANSLAAVEYSMLFGKSEVYQLASTSDGDKVKEVVAPGRILFQPALNFGELEKKWREGQRVKVLPKDAVRSEKDESTLLAMINEKNVATPVALLDSLPAEGSFRLIVLSH